MIHFEKLWNSKYFRISIFQSLWNLDIVLRTSTFQSQKYYVFWARIHSKFFKVRIFIIKIPPKCDFFKVLLLLIEY